MFYDTKTLIVVYKDEMLANQIRKLIETNDDSENGEVTGTRDDAVKIVSWTEKVWLGNKKAGNIDSKVLFLGDIKGVDKLIPVLDIQFDKHGVKYGWAGNQAVVFADPSELKSQAAYYEFLKELEALPIPEFIKKGNAPKEKAAEIDNTVAKEETVQPDKIVEADIVEEDIAEEELQPEEAKERKIGKLFDGAKRGLNAVKNAAVAVKDNVENAVDKAADHVEVITEETFRDKKMVKKQMLFYGVINLYRKDLEKFMQN